MASGTKIIKLFVAFMSRDKADDADVLVFQPVWMSLYHCLKIVKSYEEKVLKKYLFHSDVERDAKLGAQLFRQVVQDMHTVVLSGLQQGMAAVEDKVRNLEVQLEEVRLEIQEIRDEVKDVTEDVKEVQQKIAAQEVDVQACVRGLTTQDAFQVCIRMHWLTFLYQQTLADFVPFV